MEYNSQFDTEDILCITYTNDINAIQIDREEDALILYIKGTPIKLEFIYRDITEMALDINNYIHSLSKKNDQLVITKYEVFSWAEVEKLIKENEDY